MVLSGKQFGEALSIEWGMNFGIVIKVDENVTTASPTPDSLCPGLEHTVAVVTDVKLGVAMRTTINEIGREFFDIGPAEHARRATL